MGATNEMGEIGSERYLWRIGKLLRNKQQEVIDTVFVMAKHVGVKLPEDLHEILKKGQTVAVLATFSEKGVPHTTPIQVLYPKGSESILISIHKNHQGYHNMVWQKKVMLCFMDEGNVAYSILGRAGVVRAPSSVHPLMNVAHIDIIDIKSDC